MATIHNAIMMNDRMSPVFNKMAQAMTSTLNVMGQVNQKAKQGITEEAFKKAETDIKRANNEILKMNNNLRTSKQQADQTAKSFGGMKNQLMNIYAGVQLGKQAFQAMQNGTDYLDNIASRKARVSLVNDGSQTDVELQDKMAEAAIRSRANYDTFAGSTIKMNMLAGDAFGGNDEAISFMETMNKMFVVSGASAEESSAAMYQLTQAMASGKLQGDEYRSITENAPMLANAIADSLGVTRGEIKQLSSDGQLTADVIKNAVFSATDDVNQKFSNMPMTFGQAMNNLGTIASRKFQEVSDAFSEAMSGDGMQGLFDGLVVGITVAANLATGAIGVLSNAFGFLANNMDWIGPILAGIIAAIVVYNSTMGIAWLTTMKDVGAKIIHTIQSGLQTAAIIALTFAQQGLNAALAMCPLTWIIVAIIMLIALFYAGVAAMNHFAGTSISATGVICGVFMWLASVIGNIVIGMINGLIEMFIGFWNFVLSFADFFSHFMDNPVKSIVHLVGDMVNGCIDVLASLASVIDAIFGSNLTLTVEGWKQNVNDLADSLVGKQEDEFEKLNAEDYKLTRFDNTDAYESGYAFGQGIDKKIGDFFGSDNLDMFGGNGEEQTMFGDGASNPDGGKLDSVGKIDDDVTIAEEDIKLLKDIATTKFINKYSTLQPNLTVQFGDVYESGDIDRNRIMQIVDEMATEAYAVAVVQEV